MIGTCAAVLLLPYVMLRCNKMSWHRIPLNPPLGPDVMPIARQLCGP